MARRVSVGAFLVVASACRGSDGPSGPTGPDASVLPPMPGLVETFVGAGDIGWCGLPGADMTAALLDRIGGTVFTLGDNAYPSGSFRDFAECYDPSWGRHKARTRPTPGNHEYETPGAAGYFAYFGASAGPPDGYYGFRLGSWHIIALNSEISAFPGSPQLEWLRRELAANPTRCTLAYFHTPVFGSGSNGGNTHMQAAWTVMYASGVDVIVNAHNHSYERFAPQDPDGRLDAARGIRQFTAGTGGAPLTPFAVIRPNSEVRDNSAWGVLRLTLRADGYEWQFVPVAAQAFSDRGSGTCH
ncbi:MAG: metallophosphoesterase [Acidobacteria bacterium]|nr:metallophosphoesterase [Acidobacteriota bacterium]